MVGIISKDDIQSGDSSLVCHTDNGDCCMGPRYRGQWISPENETVFRDVTGERGILTLNLQGNHAKSLVFTMACCKIPDFSNVNQTVCASILGKYHHQPSVLNFASMAMNGTKGNNNYYR